MESPDSAKGVYSSLNCSDNWTLRANRSWHGEESDTRFFSVESKHGQSHTFLKELSKILRDYGSENCKFWFKNFTLNHLSSASSASLFVNCLEISNPGAVSNFSKKGKAFSVDLETFWSNLYRPLKSCYGN